MIDHLSPALRSWNMAQIRGSDTKPEKKLRSMLHRSGFRFRLHDKKLPGRPDIVLPRYQTAIFVHGCFWHRHPGCKNATTPTTRRQFWLDKFAKNVDRDIENVSALEAVGWRAIVVWECEIERHPERTLRRLRAEMDAVATK